MDTPCFQREYRIHFANFYFSKLDSGTNAFCYILNTFVVLFIMHPFQEVLVFRTDLFMGNSYHADLDNVLVTPVTICRSHA